MTVEPPQSVDGSARASLAEWLRARDDRDLVALLRARPDLAVPLPPDLAAVAGRLGVRTSVQRAVDGLDAFALRVLEGLVLAADPYGDVDHEQAQVLLAGLDGEPAIAHLIRTGLVWGDPEALRLVPTVPDAIGAYPAGLGRPAALLLRRVPDVQMRPVLRSLDLPALGQPEAARAVAAILGDRARLDALIRATDPLEREVLDRLAAGPPVG